ncbi:MAG TPA: hypothetical protein VF577_02040 [Allosphingosinicella sp.]|jgi:hypothetical protein
MRATPLMLAALLSAGSSAAQAPLGPAPPTPIAPPPALGTADGPCRFDDLRRHARGTPPLARRLGDLPPGDLELTVMREVDGCLEPVIVRHNFEAPRRRR